MGIGFSDTSINTIELPRIPKNLPYAIDDCSLAFHLGFRNKVLWWVINCKTDHYKVYRIPKRKSGVRIIHAPSPMLKAMLRKLHTRFLLPLQNDLGPHVTAYRKGLSTRNAVQQHIPPCEICDSASTGQTPKKHECPRFGACLHLDLENFFTNTTRTWIRNYFKDFGYSHYVSSLLANLLTVSDLPNPHYAKRKKSKVHTKEQPKFVAGVPQGAPTSGAICNLIADRRIDGPILAYISELNKEHGLEGDWAWKYTRYSDDLCLTCGKEFSKEEKHKIKEELTRIVVRGGYRINKKKTRMPNSYYRKVLLGMVFNQKPNIAYDRYLHFRALVHNCLTQGIETQYERAGKANTEELISYLRGNINYVGQVIEKSNPSRFEEISCKLEAAIQNYREQSNVHSN